MLQYWLYSFWAISLKLGVHMRLLNYPFNQNLTNPHHARRLGCMLSHIPLAVIAGMTPTVSRQPHR